MCGLLNSGSGGPSLEEQRRDRTLEDATPGDDTASDIYDPAEPMSNTPPDPPNLLNLPVWGVSDSTLEAADDGLGSVADDVRDVPNRFASDASDAVDAARNIGPDWLDEVTAIAIPVVVLAVLGYLFRPFATILAEVVGGE